MNQVDQAAPSACATSNKTQNIPVVEPKGRNREKKWNKMFEALAGYRAEHGGTNVPRKYQKDVDLGRWVQRQRDAQRQNILSDERQEKLNSIGFTWNQRFLTEQEAWEFRYAELVEYKKVHGECNVPWDYSANLELGRWVRAQRYFHQKKILLADREAGLNEIGFDWRNVKTAFWDNRFEELLRYLQQHGNCTVPQRYPPNPSLGKWVDNQRIAYAQKKRGKINLMTAEREAKLDAIGFTWNFRQQQGKQTIWAAVAPEPDSDCEPETVVKVEETVVKVEETTSLDRPDIVPSAEHGDVSRG
jgi:hypothetical protein